MLRTPLRLPILLLVLAVIIAGVLAGLSFLFSISQGGNKTLSEAIRTGKAPIPPYTQSMQEKVAASNGFQALVSHTDHGFEPKNVTISAGQTVRFTNNASNNLWIVATGDAAHPAYPATSDKCDPTHFDSCAALAPQDFWEFTFAKPGEWHYMNNLNTQQTGTITVN